jgi:hypothetical protein
VIHELISRPGFCDEKLGDTAYKLAFKLIEVVKISCRKGEAGCQNAMAGSLVSTVLSTGLPLFAVRVKDETAESRLLRKLELLIR